MWPEQHKQRESEVVGAEGRDVAGIHNREIDEVRPRGCGEDISFYSEWHGSHRKL